MRSHRDPGLELSSRNSKNVEFRSSRRAVRPFVKKSLLDIPWFLPSKKYLCRPSARLGSMYTYETKIDLSKQTHVKFAWPPPLPSRKAVQTQKALLRATPLPILAPQDQLPVLLVTSASAASSASPASASTSASPSLKSVNLLTDTATYSPYVSGRSTYTAIVNPSASATVAELTKSSSGVHIASSSSSAAGNSTSTDSKSTNHEKGVVLGSILGGVFGLLAIITVLFCICRSRRKRRKGTGIEKDLMYESYHSNLSSTDSSGGSRYPPEPPLRIRNGPVSPEESIPALDLPLHVPASPFDAESVINIGRGRGNPPPVPPKEIKRVSGLVKKPDRPGEIRIDSPQPIEDIFRLQNPFLSVEPPSALKFHPSRRAPPPPPSARSKPQSVVEPFETGFGTPSGISSGISSGTTPYTTPFETPQNQVTERAEPNTGIRRDSIEQLQRGRNSPSSSIYGSDAGAFLDRLSPQMERKTSSDNRLSAPPSALASSALKSWGFFSPRKSLATPQRDSNIYVYDDANADQPGYRMFDGDDLDKLKEDDN